MNVLAHRFFTYFTEAHARALAEFTEELSVNEQTVLFDEGDPSDCLYLVLEGQVELSKKSRDGTQVHLAMVEAGDYFGEMGIISDKPRGTRAMTTAFTRIAKIAGPPLLRILQEEPHVTLQLFRTILDHLRWANERYVEEVLKKGKA